MCKTKIKYLIVFLLIWMLTPMLKAQDMDSVHFVNASWISKKINKKIRWYQFHFKDKNLFNANEHISYVKVKKNRRYSFHVAAEAKQLRTVSDFAKELVPIAMINGNFFDVKNGGSRDFTKVRGQVVNTNGKSKTGQLDFHQKAAVVIGVNGQAQIKKWEGVDDWETQLSEPDVMLNGPLLLFNREEVAFDTSNIYVARHPRTCFGITQKGDVIMLVVDGRNPNSQGMDLVELRKVMRWLGCVSAINFDGGGSSTLWIKNNGVVNFPTDNRKWDHEGERKVANVLYVR